MDLLVSSRPSSRLSTDMLFLSPQHALALAGLIGSGPGPFQLELGRDVRDPPTRRGSSSEDVPYGLHVVHPYGAERDDVATPGGDDLLATAGVDGDVAVVEGV